MAPRAQSASPMQQNMQARQLVIAQALDMWQSIYQQTFTTGAATGAINIPLRNVGLIKRLLVEIKATVTVGAAETQTLTKWGPANFLSQVVLTDLSNTVRINTTGWHLHWLATVRRQAAYGAAYTNDSPVNVGSSYNVISSPVSYTTSQNTFSMVYEIPLAYGDYDLRGALYANVVNATMNLQLVVNPNFFVPSTGDGTLAVYKSSTAQLGVLTTFTVTVYQNYLDQIPMGSQGPLLPLLDLATLYMLQNTTVGALVAGQDNPIPYANFRQFMSTSVIYDNAGVLNAGTDVNYWAIQSANATYLLKYDPTIAAMMTRNLINDDMPIGGTYFDHRKKPLQTIQYGNLQLTFNPITVTNASTSLLFVGYEMFAQANTITQAGSLYGN